MRTLSFAGAAVLILAATAYAQHDHGGMQTMPMPSALTDGPYIEAMAGRYQDGIRLAQLAADRATNAQVKELALSLMASQQDELNRLADLKTTGTAAGSHEGMAHGAAAASKKMSTDDLERASGKAFDQAFLNKMIKHHQESIGMSRGADLKIGDLRDFARRTSQEQQRLVKEMQRLKKQIG